MGPTVQGIVQPRSAWATFSVFDVAEDSVVALFDIVEELVSLPGAGCELYVPPELWLLVSVLVPEVWAIDTPPASAAAAARVVSAFLVAFICVTPR